MPTASRIVLMALRFVELVCACVVAAIIGSYLHAFDKANAWPAKRFIYIEVIAGISIFLSLLWLFPFTARLPHWPVDLVLSAAWFAAFGLLVNFLDYHDCGGRRFGWGGITRHRVCSRWTASEAFSFISAICWLLSAIVGIWLLRKPKDDAAAPTDNAPQVLHRTTAAAGFANRRLKFANVVDVHRQDETVEEIGQGDVASQELVLLALHDAV